MTNKPTMGVVAPDPTPKTARERLDEIKSVTVLLPSEDDDGSAATIAQLRADLAQATSETQAAIKGWREDVARLTAERDEARATCNGSCDIALARRQVGPDGVVPGNARECAELWEREAARITADFNRVAAKAMDWGREKDTAIRERDFAINCIGELTEERDTARSSLAAALVRVEALESERDALQHSLNEECVRRAVDVENLQAELGAALRARVDDLKAVTTGLADLGVTVAATVAAPSGEEPTDGNA